MSKFIDSLMARSSGMVTDVRPRIPGKYEQGTGSSPVSLEREAELYKKTIPFSEGPMQVNERKVFQPGNPDYVPQDSILSSTTNKSYFSKPLSGTSDNTFTSTSEPGIGEKQKLKISEPGNYELLYSGRIADKSAPLQSNVASHQEINEKVGNKSVNSSSGEVNPIHAVQIGPIKQPGKFARQPPPVPEIIPADQVQHAALRRNKEKYIITPNTHSFQEGLRDVNDGLNNERATSEPVQTINVSIGRVEVRVFQPPPQAPVKTKNDVQAIMGLDQYLDQRKQGIK